MNRLKVYIWPLCLVAFAAFSLYLLVVRMSPYLAETAVLTPFFTTSSYFADMVSEPCGMVYYLASLLQSCFAKPWLGALLLTSLLLLLAEILRRTFKVGVGFAPLCLVPSLFLLLNYTMAGYMLWLVKTPALAFTLPLGILSAVIISAVAGKLSRPWFMCGVWMLVFSTVGYWLMGTFGLLACLFVALPQLWNAVSSHRWLHLIYILVVLLLAFLAPRIIYGQGIFVMRLSDLYVAGLPDYNWNDSERHLYFPAVIAMAIGILLSVRSLKSSSLYLSVVSLCLSVVSAVVVWKYSCMDRNLLDALRQKQAIERGDYYEAVCVARSSKTPPTRVQVMLTREALWLTGEAGNLMFSFPDGDSPYLSPRPFQYMRLLCGRTLYYYEGKVNYAYRWCMEDMVEYGKRPDYLMYMVKCAIVNGEWKLASKYINALSHTLWYKDFAGKYSAYLTDHSLVDRDKEMAAIRPLLRYGDVLDGDGGRIEAYILNSYALSQGGSREIVERALMYSLVTKNLTDFWQRFMVLLPGWNGHIPVHCQEAALMVARLQGGVDVSLLPIDQNVYERFSQLVDKSATNGDDASNAYMLKPEFGDTYWYYYFFVEGLKTN